VGAQEGNQPPIDLLTRHGWATDAE
jgi:hypothetical protein